MAMLPSGMPRQAMWKFFHTWLKEEMVMTKRIGQAFALTAAMSFMEPVTIRYPNERPYHSPNHRGEHYLSVNITGEESCIGCQLCEVTCPAQAIDMETGPREDGRRGVLAYNLNHHRCIYCGLCQDACPTHAIVHTPNLEFASFDYEGLERDKEELMMIP